jgi:hypothetical protein
MRLRIETAQLWRLLQYTGQSSTPALADNDLILDASEATAEA